MTKKKIYVKILYLFVLCSHKRIIKIITLEKVELKNWDFLFYSHWLYAIIYKIVSFYMQFIERARKKVFHSLFIKLFYMHLRACYLYLNIRSYEYIYLTHIEWTSFSSLLLSFIFWALLHFHCSQIECFVYIFVI